jgi:hypothetical protein
MADRQQSLRDRMPAAGLTPFAPVLAHTRRRAQHATQDCPRHHGRNDDDAQHQHEDRQRGLDAVAAPGQHDIASLLGDPGRAGRSQRDQQQKKNDPDH